MAKIIQVNENLEVKKADVIVKARYKLNPLSLKFITSLIAGLKRGDSINEIYQFKVKDFKELTGLKRKDLYWAIKESLKELLEKPIYIPKGKNENDNSFLVLNWVASAEYQEGEGIVEFEISSKLRPYLLEAQKKFLKYRLENILNLRSSYSIRLYEILKDWLELQARYGKRAEKIISLDEFREMLEIPRSYKYGMLKQRIIEKAKTELGKHTDIIFEYEEIKTGRKVTYLKFIIEPNVKNLKENGSQYDKYFKSRKSFVELLRENYSGHEKTFGYKTINGSNFWLKLDTKGLVYGIDKNANIKEFNAIESAEIYDLWFTIAQNSELYQQLLINKECIMKMDKDIQKHLFSEVKSLKDKGII
jgi:plasmid replication initiation protein